MFPQLDLVMQCCLETTHSSTTEGVLHHLLCSTTNTPLDAAISDNTRYGPGLLNIQGHNTCVKGMLQHRGTWCLCRELLRQLRTQQVCRDVVGASRSTHTTGHPVGESKGHAGDGKQQTTASTQHQPSFRGTEGVTDRVIATHNNRHHPGLLQVCTGPPRHVHLGRPAAALHTVPSPPLFGRSSLF